MNPNEKPLPKLPPALRKPSPTAVPVSPINSNTTPKPPGSEPSSKIAIAPAVAPALVSAPSKAPPRPPTGGTVTRTPPVKNDRLFTPPPKSAANPRIPVLDRLAVFEGHFAPEGSEPFSVETPLTGDSKRDTQSLVNVARRRFPTGKMALKSTRIFTRDRETAPSYPGASTLGSLFGESGSLTEVALEVGQVFWEGQSCQIFIKNLRVRSAITISLRPPSGGAISFSNQIQSNRLLKELPSILREVLGSSARELRITVSIAE